MARTRDRCPAAPADDKKRAIDTAMAQIERCMARVLLCDLGTGPS